MKNILLTISSCGVEDTEPIEVLEKAGYNVIFNPYKRKLCKEEVIELIVKHDPVGVIAGVEPLTAEVLSKAKGLRVISRCGVGLDNVDSEAANNLGIQVYNTPDAPCLAVAELAVALMLAALRKINQVDQRLKSGNWFRPMGNLLSGKTVGIVGCGKIGSHLAKLLSGFEVELIGYDNCLDEHQIINLCSLDGLLAKAEIVTLHVPYAENTKYIVDRDFLHKMRPDSILINTARGGLVDEKALYEAVKSGRIAGACLDTFEEEPYSGELTELENVILTSHIGSYAIEARVNMEKEAALNLLKALHDDGVR